MRDMGLSHREFFISFKPLRQEWQCQIGDNGVRIDYEGGQVDIVLGEEGRRRFAASLSLPRTEVTFEFRCLSAAQQRAFMLRFDLAYRRGGG